jgi:hypothetical protein
MAAAAVFMAAASTAVALVAAFAAEAVEAADGAARGLGRWLLELRLGLGIGDWRAPRRGRYLSLLWLWISIWLWGRLRVWRRTRLLGEEAGLDGRRPLSRPTPRKHLRLDASSLSAAELASGKEKLKAVTLKPPS